MRAAWAPALAAVAALALGAGPATAALPRVDYQLAGRTGANGWYIGPVSVSWTVADALSTSGCDQRYLTDDTAGVQITCTATNGSGTVPATTSPIRIDQTPPTGVTAAPARGPDAGPWYTQPVDIAWSGTDAVSGIAACTALTYAGPDGAAASPAGTCTDRAGNISAPVPFGLAYDATPPAVADVAVTFHGRTATVRWTAGADADRVLVERRPAAAATASPGRTILDAAGTTRRTTDQGLRRGRAYAWTVTVRDAAGNTASATATATVPRRPGPPTLRWKAVSRASYYNVQLFRGGHKILSAWPARPRYRLHRIWRYQGHRHRLLGGRYRWYVWAGFGPRSARRYGHLHAHGRLRVR
ncbi:MAG TPA: hypothetical protein VFT50_18665 [Baekduia sp.]|nr:hypothetical protein [Baekduia sp.]